MLSKSKIGNVTARILLWMWVLFTFFIISLAVMNSFKTSAEIYTNLWAIPVSINWANYENALFTSQMYRYFFNSVFICVMTLLILTIISAMAAYILARFPFKGKWIITALVVFGLGVPEQLLLIPLYRTISAMGLVNSFTGMITVYTSLCVPFTIFVLIGFFTSLPNDIREAAIIDGASESYTFWKVMFPLAQPGLIAVASFNFVWMWNEYLLALVFTNDKSVRTMSLGMYALQNSMTFTIDWGALYAGVVLMFVPAVIVFILLHKYIISGITLGAVKG